VEIIWQPVRTENKVICIGNNPWHRLHTLNHVIGKVVSQLRALSSTLKVAPALWNPSQDQHGGQHDIPSLPSKLLPHCFSKLVKELLVEGGHSRKLTGKRGLLTVAVIWAEALPPVIHIQRRDT